MNDSDGPADLDLHRTIKKLEDGDPRAELNVRWVDGAREMDCQITTECLAERLTDADLEQFDDSLFEHQPGKTMAPIQALWLVLELRSMAQGLVERYDLREAVDNRPEDRDDDERGWSLPTTG